MPGKGRSLHFLMHTAGRKLPLHLTGLYDIKPPEQLREELLMLQKYFHFIGTREYVDRLHAGRLTRKKRFATFTCDDGLLDFKINIWPVIRELEIPCTLFVVKHFVEHGAVLYRFKSALAVALLQRRIMASCNPTEQQHISRQCDQLLSIHDPCDHDRIDAIAGENGIDLDGYFNTHRLYLTESELSCLIREGLRLGSHGIHHHHGKFLSPKQLKTDIVTGAEYVASVSGQKTVEHAFPFNSEGLPLKHLCTILKQNPQVTHYFDTGRGFNGHPDITGRLPIDMMTPKQALRRFAFEKIKGQVALSGRY